MNLKQTQGNFKGVGMKSINFKQIVRLLCLILSSNLVFYFFFFPSNESQGKVQRINYSQVVIPATLLTPFIEQKEVIIRNKSEGVYIAEVFLLEKQETEEGFLSEEDKNQNVTLDVPNESIKFFINKENFFEVLPKDYLHQQGAKDVSFD